MPRPGLQALSRQLFTLSQLPGLMQLLSADDAANIQASSRYSSLHDASGNNNHAIQPTFASQFAVDAASPIAGKSAFRMGNGRATFHASTNPISLGSYTMIATLCLDGASTALLCEHGPNASTTDGMWALGGPSGSGAALALKTRRGSGATTQNDGADVNWAITNRPLVFAYRYEQSTGVATIFTNRIPYVGASNSPVPAGSTPTSQSLYIGARTGGVLPVSGWKRSWVLSSTALSNTNMQRAMDLLSVDALLTPWYYDGNSITAGTGASDLAHSWAQLVVASFGLQTTPTVRDVRNWSVSGNTVDQRYAAFPTGASVGMITTTHAPNVLLTGLLGNEVHLDVAQGLASLAAYYRQAKAAGVTTMVVHTVAPRNTGAGFDAYRTGLNAALKTAATGIYFDVLVDLTGNAAIENLANYPDNVHPNDTAHAAIAATHVTVLTPLLASILS